MPAKEDNTIMRLYLIIVSALIIALFEMHCAKWPTKPNSTAKPVIDTLYAESPSVRVNDTIRLHAAVSDSIGHVTSYEWKAGQGKWISPS